MQIYAGGTQGPITFDHVIIGPGEMNGAILGEQYAAQVNDVTFSNVVCLDAEENCFIDNPGGNAQRWHWDHVTTILTPLNPIGTGASAFYMDGADDSVTNSIIAGNNARLPDNTIGAGNCQYNTQGSGAPLIGGEGIDPQLGAVQSFPNNATLEAWSNATFAPGPGSPCAGKGADLTSVAQLLSQ
jgi:hypothetical protein